MANRKVEDVEGIGPVNGEKLRAAGCATTDALLEAACTKKGRAGLAEKTGIGESQILKWVNMADLFRIQGVAGEFAELLECAGVDTVKELATRNAENLAAKVQQVNEEKKLTRRLPNLEIVKDWIQQAKSLPPTVTH